MRLPFVYLFIYPCLLFGSHPERFHVPHLVVLGVGDMGVGTKDIATCISRTSFAEQDVRSGPGSGMGKAGRPSVADGCPALRFRVSDSGTISGRCDVR